jgi:plasmid stabilization system protein ParE
MRAGEVAIRYSYRALRDLDESARWWSERNPGSVSRLEFELGFVLRAASRASIEGVSIGRAGKHGIRCLFVPKIRYFVYFRVVENGDLWVVRVVHERRQKR